MTTIAFFLTLLAAACGALSAWYWFKSARTALPPIDKSTGRPLGAVSMLEINKTIVEGAAANRVAAAWTALAAIVGAVAAVFGKLA